MRNFEEDVEKWYETEYGENYHIFHACLWIEIPFSFQWGVYVDFLNENGIKVFLKFNNISGKVGFEIYEKQQETYKSELTVPMLISEYTLDEARRAALKKAINLYENGH